MSLPDIPDTLLEQFSAYVTEHMALRFPPKRSEDLRRGLRSAALEFGFSDPAQCAGWLMKNPLSRSQVEILASHLTIGETYFFRDPKVFEALQRDILPPLIQQGRRKGKYLRIWSAGCATGEEPYSIAITLSRIVPDIHSWKITILGTDINPSFLSKAMAGIYGEWSFRGLPTAVRERYFAVAGPGRYRIDPAIQDCVTFSYLNLAEDIYPSLLNNTNAMDIIFCRNVIMYFSPKQQAEVAEKFHRCLVPEGLLAVSPTEMSAATFTGFRQLHLPGAVFYRKSVGKGIPHATTPTPVSPTLTVQPPPPLMSPPSVAAIQRPTLDPLAEACRKAETMFEQGRYEETERMAVECLAADEGNVAALALLARVRANQGRLKEARELCEQAINRDKVNAANHYLLAAILQETGLVDEAATTLKRALYLNQDLVVAHFALGNIALHLGMTGETRRHFTIALGILGKQDKDELVPFSEGVTAGRMREIIDTTMKEKVVR